MQTLTKKVLLFLAILITLIAIGFSFKYVSDTFSPVQIARFVGVMITWIVCIGVAAIGIIGAWNIASEWVDIAERRKATKAEIAAAEAKWNKRS